MEHVYPMEDLLGLLQVIKLCPKLWEREPVTQHKYQGL